MNSDTFLDVDNLFKLDAVGSSFVEVLDKPLLYIQSLTGRRTIMGSIQPTGAILSGATIIDVSKLPDADNLRLDFFAFKLTSFAAGVIQEAFGIYQGTPNIIELFSTNPLDPTLIYSFEGDFWTKDVVQISKNLRDK